MTRADYVQLIGLLGALVLVGGALAARRRVLARDYRLWRWAALWIGIFTIAFFIATNFT